jgi:hypothetical protein
MVSSGELANPLPTIARFGMFVTDFLQELVQRLI